MLLQGAGGSVYDPATEKNVSAHPRLVKGDPKVRGDLLQAVLQIFCSHLLSVRVELPHALDEPVWRGSNHELLQRSRNACWVPRFFSTAVPLLWGASSHCGSAAGAAPHVAAVGAAPNAAAAAAAAGG